MTAVTGFLEGLCYTVRWFAVLRDKRIPPRVETQIAKDLWREILIVHK